MSAVPKLRFSEFDYEWMQNELNDYICAFNKKTKEENEYPILTSSRNGLMLQGEYYGENRLTSRSNVGYNIVPVGYITFRNRSDDRRFYFNINNLGFTGAISHFYPVFNVSDADIQFFLELLNFKRDELGKLAVGTSQTVLSFTELKGTKFYLPSLPEQQKIASFLSSVDKKIDLLRQKKNELELYKKGLMQKIFLQEIRFKADDGSDFPDWEDVSLGDVVTISKGKQLNRDTLTAGAAYPVINGGVTPSGYHDEFNTEANSITISEGGNSCGHVDFQRQEFWCGGHCYVVTPIGEIIDNDFAFQNLKFRQADIMRLRVGSGLPNIQKGDLLKLSLFLPVSIDEQQKIASFLSAVDAKIKKTSSQIEEMETFKKGLLQQMFV